jgi:ABC-type uncharacterized transport system permease subunit
MQTLLIIACIICYLSGTGLQISRITGRLSNTYPILLILSIVAFAIHGILLYHWIDLQLGQNLSVFNLLSFAVWLVILFTLIMSMRHPVENLFILIFPLAVISMMLVWLFPEQHVINMQGQTSQIVHIFSAAGSFAVVCSAALQAILLAIQNYFLRHQHASGLIARLPPLEIMQRLLFQIIWVGFFLLTWVLISSFFAFDDLFKPPLLQKTIMTLFSWMVFAVLLFGKHVFGWRGKKVLYYTLTGFGLLIVIYFGSQVVLG